MGADKKFGLELSVGFGLSKPADFHTKASGVDDFIHQYSQQLGAQYQTTGQFTENLSMIPVSAAALYQLSDGLYLKGGLELSFGNQSSEKSFAITAPTFDEQNDYLIENKITTFMPFVGIEKRFSNFGVYALLGYNNVKLKNTFQRDFAQDGYTSQIIDLHDVSGSAASFVIGANYRFSLGDTGHLLVKLEYLYSKFSELTGSRNRSGSSSTGETVNDTIEGTLYSYRVDVYNTSSFYTWDMFEEEPTSSWISDVAPLALDISSIRLLVGFAF
jgi:hypothetical protein